LSGDVAENFLSTAREPKSTWGEHKFILLTDLRMSSYFNSEETRKTPEGGVGYAPGITPASQDEPQAGWQPRRGHQVSANTPETLCEGRG